MSKIAFIFPGQGAQYFGMGKDFYEAFPKCRERFEEASELLELDMKKLCFEENDKLDITEYTQAALVTTELAILEGIKKKGIEPAYCAGLSLGEYSALVASGAVGFADAVKLVRQRGILMQEAVPVGKGAMVAIVGLSEEKLLGICQEICGCVEIANYNSPVQMVLSGEREVVLEAKRKAELEGALMAVELNVSGPFHSSLLMPAGKEMRGYLNKISWENPNVPYVANLTADYVKDIAVIPEYLEKQIYSPVRWCQSIQRMVEDGVDTFIEIGPGKTLAGFNKKICKGVKTISISKIEDLEKL